MNTITLMSKYLSYSWSPYKFIVGYNDMFSVSRFETGHGIRSQEKTEVRMNPAARGVPEDENFGKATIAKHGQISYQSPEGKTISLQYTADEHGFRPVGDHLPTSPPMPADIAAAIRTLPKLEAHELQQGARAEHAAPLAAGGGGVAGVLAPARGGAVAPLAAGGGGFVGRMAGGYGSY